MVAAACEPGIAVAVLHAAAVGGELRRRFGFGRARDLRQASAGEFAHEHVAVAHEGRARARAIEHCVGAVRIRHRGRVDHAVACVGGVDAMAVAHRRTGALEVVVEVAAVHAPVRILDRRPDPVGVGHRLLEGDRARGSGGEAEQGDEAGEGCAVHGDSGTGRNGRG